MTSSFEMNEGRRKEATTEMDNGSQSETRSSVKRVRNILFFGDSLTAGYGLRPAEAFPAIIQKKIDLAGLQYRAVNAGVSGETTFGGNSRIDGIIKDPVDVFVLELGINDGLRGIPVAETRRNLQSIIDKVNARYLQIPMVLAGMQVPPWLGQKYAEDFRIMFPLLASKNNIALIPFLLQGVAGVRSLNLPDAAHPSAEGQKLVAENVWAILENVLKKQLATDTSASI